MTDLDTDDIADETVILIADSPGRSALAALLCATFGCGFGYISLASFLGSPCCKPIGLPGLIIGLVFSTFVLWTAAMNAWRFFGPNYDAVIAPDGLTLHPSVSSRLVHWEEISASRLAQRYIWRQGKKPVIELELTNQVRSLVMPLGSKRVSIALGGPSSQGQMKDAARLIKKYRLAAGWRH